MTELRMHKDYEFPIFSATDDDKPADGIEEYSYKELAALEKEPTGIFLPESEEETGSEKFEEAKRILAEAEELAREIIANANSEAEAIKASAQEEGRSSGYAEGFQAGESKAFAEHRETLEKERRISLQGIGEAIRKIERERESIISDHLNDLRDLAVSVAEKVVNVSLRSSGEVIERMIVSATEKIKNRSWAKIYISDCDAELIMKSDADILDAVKNVSENVKIIIMDNKPAGTCLIELPDQIIDASVSAQLENIKDLLGTHHE